METKFNGTSVTREGTILKVGDTMPDFRLTNPDYKSAQAALKKRS